MKLIDRYITKTVLASIILVVFMLTGLQMFILFVNQLGDIGKADYNITQAVLFILLGMPYQVYLFFPMASLLGCLIGLGIMANHHELVVMRAAGMSIGQITYAVLKLAIVLVFIVTCLGEMLLPKLVLLANDRKMQALSAGQSLRTAKGIWLRHHNDFIAISTVLPGNNIEDVHQFHFDSMHRLQYIRHLDQVSYIHGFWQAHGIDETEITAHDTRAHHQDAMRWDVALKPHVLSVSTSEPDEMTFYELHQCLKAQKMSHQTAQNYQLMYWQRLVQPFTTMVMMMLAIPFIFGPLRSSTMGSKLLIGAMMGFGFYIMNRFFGSLSQIYQFSALTAALGPTVFCALLGFYLMRRVR
ncbi:MAG: LPS export ABC transporter permease LptG [Legionellaceae bacterium]|nr:LPS export ABC transporter permease LptG [Legionellaceae bacterium]